MSTTNNRKRRHERAARGEIPIPHGGDNTLKEYGCRCALCVEANRDYRRRLDGAQPRRVFSEAERRRALSVYASRGRRAAAEAAGVCGETISRWAKEAGVSCYRPPLMHGLAGYTRGCRCGPCVAGFRDHVAEQKQSREARVAAGTAPKRIHGTESGYMNWGCRCDPCKAAGSANNRRQRSKRTAKRRAA